MKVIFLDIDGVMNCESTKDRFQGFVGLDDVLMERLKRLVDATDAKIVLSSSWRFCKDLATMQDTWKYMQDRLGEHDIHIIDCTPACIETSYRGWEIQTWFKNWQGEPVESFIILDDDNDLKPYGRRHIQTSWRHGFEEKHLEKAIKMLAEPCEPWFDDTPYWGGGYSAEHRQI